MDTNKHEFFETEKEWIPAFAGIRIFLKIIPGHLCLPMYRDGLLFFLLLLITDN